jgi:hypothetical protein
MTDDEIFQLMTQDVAAQAASGQRIDMTQIGVNWDYLAGGWKADDCGICAIGAWMLNRQPFYWGSTRTTLGQEFKRPDEWTRGLIHGTDSHYPGMYDANDPDYVAGYLLGRRILDWVNENIHITA